MTGRWKLFLKNAGKEKNQTMGMEDGDNKGNEKNARHLQKTEFTEHATLVKKRDTLPRIVQKTSRPGRRRTDFGLHPG